MHVKMAFQLNLYRHWPELNGVKLDLEMTDFNNGLGLGDLDDLAKKDQPAENNGSRFLLLESYVVLVS